MKRQAYSIMAAALLLAMGALLTTACSNEDTAIDNPISTVGNSQPIQFTATLAPKSGGGAQTRAITTGKDGEDKEILNVAWAEGEQVAVYYQKSDDSYATATATVGTPNGDGSAPITASLPDAKGGPAKFVYPASLHNGTGDIDESRLLTKQRGILTYSGTGLDYSISKNFDAATAEATVTVSGGEATVSGTVAMQSRVCICKFTFSAESLGQIESLEHVDIHIDGRTYSITPSNKYSSEKCLYVAMLPVTGSDALFGAYNQGMTSGSVTTYGNNYVKLARNVTLEAGKFYRNIPIQCIQAMEYTGSKTTPILPTSAAVILNNLSVECTSGSAFNILESVAKQTDNFIIVLKGDNRLYANQQNCSAIAGPSQRKTLTIGGNGRLTAETYEWTIAAKAIGGPTGTSVGYINIHGTLASLKVFGGIGAPDGYTCDGIVIDGMANWADTSTEHMNFTRSTTWTSNDTWMLTHK